MSQPRSTTRLLAAFRRSLPRVRADAYLVGEIWVTAPDWVAGDRFDALMNYPLAEAILGFVGGPSLDMAVVQPSSEYRDTSVGSMARGSQARLGASLGAYDADVVAVQLNLLGVARHARGH